MEGQVLYRRLCYPNILAGQATLELRKVSKFPAQQLIDGSFNVLQYHLNPSQVPYCHWLIMFINKLRGKMFNFVEIKSVSGTGILSVEIFFEHITSKPDQQSWA